MQPENAVLALMIETCRAITRDKIDMINMALSIRSKVTRVGDFYDPLNDALAQLYKLSRAKEFNSDQWRETIKFADMAWWDWFDRYPLANEYPFEHLNYTPPLAEQLELRTQLKAKYAIVEKP